MLNCLLDDQHKEHNPHISGFFLFHAMSSLICYELLKPTTMNIFNCDTDMKRDISDDTSQNNKYKKIKSKIFTVDPLELICYKDSRT
jgi:hypothetical protein